MPVLQLINSLIFRACRLSRNSRWVPISPLSTRSVDQLRRIHTLLTALHSYKATPQVPISLMDSDSQVGCLGNFFWSTLHRIKPSRPKSSSRARISQATNIAKGRSEVVESESHQQKEGILYLDPHCDYSYSPPNEWWTSVRPPSYSAAKEPLSAVDEEVAATVERTLDELNPKLRDLSLKIHGIFLRRIMYDKRIIHSLNKFRSPGTPVPGKVHNAISHQCNRAVVVELISSGLLMTF